MLPQGFYFETIKPGNGKNILSSTDVLVSYVIENGFGDVLSAQHKCWIDLSQTISSFAHGMKGMQEGEIRNIYIHPKYGYGALTTLTPCVTLIAKVTLHQVNDKLTGHISSLVPIDLEWVTETSFFEKVKAASEQDACYLGHLWGAWLSKSSDIDFSKLCNQLKSLFHNQETKVVLEEQHKLCNRVYWNLIVATTGD